MAEPETTTAKEMQGRHARMLGRLAELGMTLAEDLHQRALAAEAPAEAQRLADAFHKLSRSVRQSLALEARLHRDAARADRERACEAEARAAAPRRRKRAQAKASLARLIWTEAEDLATYRHWDEGADRLLQAAEYDPDFLQKPIAQMVETLAEILKAKPPPGDKPTLPPIKAVEWRLILPEDEEKYQDPPPEGEGDREAVDAAPPEEEHPQPEPPRPRGLPGEYPPWEC